MTKLQIDKHHFHFKINLLTPSFKRLAFQEIILYNFYLSVNFFLRTKAVSINLKILFCFFILQILFFREKTKLLHVSIKSKTAVFIIRLLFINCDYIIFLVRTFLRENYRLFFFETFFFAKQILLFTAFKQVLRFSKGILSRTLHLILFIFM